MAPNAWCIVPWLRHMVYDPWIINTNPVTYAHIFSRYIGIFLEILWFLQLASKHSSQLQEIFCHSCNLFWRIWYRDLLSQAPLHPYTGSSNTYSLQEKTPLAPEGKQGKHRVIPWKFLFFTWVFWNFPPEKKFLPPGWQIFLQTLRPLLSFERSLTLLRGLYLWTLIVWCWNETMSGIVPHQKTIGG